MPFAADTLVMPLSRPRIRSRNRVSGARPSLGYEIEPELGVVRVDLFDALDVPQLAHAFEVILRDPTFRPGYHVCVDCRRLGRLPPRERLFAAGKEVRGLGLTWQVGRVGIVVRRPNTRHAARCLPMVLPAGMIARTRVVVNEREALSWFDISPTPTRAGKSE
jgi:hypothetical protein